MHRLYHGEVEMLDHDWMHICLQSNPAIQAFIILLTFEIPCTLACVIRDGYHVCSSMIRLHGYESDDGFDPTCIR